MAEPLIEVEDLTVEYRADEGSVTAVSDASFSIEPGEYFGLVGESGCGKSTIAEALMLALDDNGSVTSGRVRYRGKEIQDYTQAEMNEEIRWAEISLIPQSSMNSLDPLQRIVDQAVEIARTHTEMPRDAVVDRLGTLFDVMGLPESRVTDYPHQFSGGMQQRAIIALSLLLEPSLIIADEPTTALDVIMQDQIFKHLKDIEVRTDTSLLLITHDISLVFESCDRMAVMHAGQVAEVGPVTDIYDRPRHPYSIQLQQAFPDIRHPNRKLSVIEGAPPQNRGQVDYCTFCDRCPWAIDECRSGAPALEAPEGSETEDDDHVVACIRRDEIPELLAEADAPVPDGGDVDD
jgi:oligopeptide/dipeptide ABC transporter ATP-binding protein